MRVRLLLSLFLCAAALGQTAKQPPPSPAVQAADAAAQRAEEAAKAAVAAQQLAEKQRDETLKRLDTVSTDIVGRAAVFQTIATWIVGFVAFAVTAATIFTSIVAMRTNSTLDDSLKKIKEGVVTSKAATAEILEMKEGIEKHKLFQNNLQDQINAVIAEIEKKLLTALTPGTGLIGVNLGSAIPQRSYEDDALIVFSDRLNLTDDKLTPQRLATCFVMLGNYWRRTKEYGRAVERIRRAIELDPSSASAHKALGRAIWNAVAEELDASNNSTASPAQLTALQESQTELETARKLLAAKNQLDEEIAYDLGTILRLKGELAQSVDEYRHGAQLSKDLARNQGREPDWDFEYAIACLFAANKQHQEALDELKTVIGKTESWSQERQRVESRDYRNWMKSDPDFAIMLKEAAWQPLLMAL